MLAKNYLFNYFSVTPFCNTEPHGIRGLQPITHAWLLKLLFLKYPPSTCTATPPDLSEKPESVQGQSGQIYLTRGFASHDHDKAQRCPILEKLPTPSHHPSQTPTPSVLDHRDSSCAAFPRPIMDWNAFIKTSWHWKRQ